MRVALLSAGPSLTRTFKARLCKRYDLCIAVNTAATLFRCDWWSCADDWRYVNITPLGRPNLYSMAPELDKMRAHCPDKLKVHPELLTWEDSKRDLNAGIRASAGGPPDNTMSWSCPSALVLAIWLGATSIDAYGADGPDVAAGRIEGTADCTGQKLPHRDLERFERETRLCWRPLVAWCKGLGVPVRRFSPCVEGGIEQ